MAGGVLITRIKRRNEALSERKVGGCQLGVSRLQVCRQAPLLLVHQEPTLRRKSRCKEERERPRRYIPVREDKYRNDGAVERRGCHDDRQEVLRRLRPFSVSPQGECQRRRCSVTQFSGKGCGRRGCDRCPRPRREQGGDSQRRSTSCSADDSTTTEVRQATRNRHIQPKRGSTEDRHPSERTEKDSREDGGEKRDRDGEHFSAKRDNTAPLGDRSDDGEADYGCGRSQGYARKRENGRCCRCGDAYAPEVHSHRATQISEFATDLIKNLRIPQKGYNLLLAVSPTQYGGNPKCVS